MEDRDDLGSVYRLVGAVLVIVATVTVFGYRAQRSNPGTRAWNRAQESARVQVVDWPQQSRLMAHVQLERLGPPDRQSRETLTWTGRKPFRRIAVHAYPTRYPLEHVVDYIVPPERLQDILSFRRGITVDMPLGELSARSEREATNVLALNLIHEIAAERRSLGEAVEFYGRVETLAAAGKTSPYLEGLVFTPRQPWPKP